MKTLFEGRDARIEAALCGKTLETVREKRRRFIEAVKSGVGVQGRAVEDKRLVSLLFEFVACSVGPGSNNSFGPELYMVSNFLLAAYVPAERIVLAPS